LDSGQRAAADKLRSALKDMDDSDLEPLVQRTTDRLRAGSTGGNSRDVESEIVAGLARLDQQAHEAQRALDAGGAQPGGEGTEEALNRVARLRDQVNALSRAGSAQPGNGQQPGDGQQAGGNQAGGNQAGGSLAGDSQPGGGGGTRAFVDNNIDTGGNARPGVQAHAPAQVASLRDGQQLIRQGIGELQGLRAQAGTDADAQRQIQQLINEMQHVDLRRFPGNPQMVEHIHQQLLSDIDTLELQLRQGLDAQQSGQIRSTDPLAVPRGYEDAVADYFRRLSSANTANDTHN
jgi:HPt (histidine-containing phosphotransfer) domain-containing protein